MKSHLFSPFKLRELTLPNRIVVSPMAQYSAEEGCATDWHFMHLGSMSVSGAGLLIIEATSMERDARLSPGDLGLWSDENEAALQPIVEFCRKDGGGLHQRDIIGIIEDGLFPRGAGRIDMAGLFLGLREILPVTPVAQIEAIGAPRQRQGFGPLPVEIDFEQKFR